MEYSIDWGNEVWNSLRWLAIAFAITVVSIAVLGWLLARYSRWGRPFWNLVGGFFTERETRVRAWTYVIVLIVLGLFGVRITVLFSYFGNDLFTAMQTIAQGVSAGDGGQAMLDAGKSAFWHSMAVFGILATIHVIRTLIELYLGAAFEIKMRWWLTAGATADWMQDNAFYRNRFVDLGDTSKDADIQPGIDNPDQRIEADITNIASTGRGLFFGSGGSTSNGLIPAVATIVSFTIILWNLSGPVDLLGVEIPRMMVWLVLMFVLVATVIAFWIGRPLIRLNFWRERLTANFRYSLVRIRDGAENVAFYGGERVEHAGLMSRFSAVVANYWRIIYVSIAFSGWNFIISQTVRVLPYVVQAPRFFDGRITLGDMTQTSDAFINMADALSFFRESYADFTNFRASIIRLDGLQSADESSRSLKKITTVDVDRAVRLADVDITTPDGDELIRDLSLTLAPGDALVVKGRSGSGKTTLLRGLAGLWPFVDGEFSRPAGDRTLFLSQIPYIPLGDLRTAVAYPALPDDVGDESIRSVLEKVFLPHLTSRLDEEQDWSKVLSPGEQQRVAFARVLLTKPEVVFMDEATSAVDEGLEFSLYTLIRSELPTTIVVSISHRSSTDQHHTEVLELTGGGTWELRPVPSTAGG
ncbi:ABC transporter ATP-binding protein/permease [Gordonia soli]|uniref:Putative ABC transporter permease/ATP-binding protein n=1 Tax=Gordonia soli NBRC 108243 TaxID=1223545 RepID=M0QNI7_9ACTN|nr:ABC transporter ATP-binding protein/permease [Gordonia soli]GAC69964.1 putative ABC transporter permease/ATP-binding protein [Gordonia soli NBRC 108243]